MTPKDLLSDERHWSLEATLLAIRKLSPEGYVFWGMEALRDDLRGKVGEVGDLTLERIAAIRVAISSPDVLLEWPVFENVAQAFCWQKPLFGVLQTVIPEMAAVTLREVYRLRNAVPEQKGFPLQEVGDEVLRFIAAVFLENGFWYIPPVETCAVYLTKRGISPDEIRLVLPYFGALAGVQPHMDRFARENDAYRSPDALRTLLVAGKTKVPGDTPEAYAVQGLANFVDNLLLYERAAAASLTEMTKLI